MAEEAEGNNGSEEQEPTIALQGNIEVAIDDIVDGNGEASSPQNSALVGNSGTRRRHNHNTSSPAPAPTPTQQVSIGKIHGNNNNIRVFIDTNDGRVEEEEAPPPIPLAGRSQGDVQLAGAVVGVSQGDNHQASQPPKVESRLSVHTSSLEPGSFASRSTVRMIHEVVSKFDSQKIELVKSIGFHGILEFPPIRQFNRKFTLWLMSCVNEESCSLSISDHLNIPFNKADVGRVFGIPSSGRMVLDDRVSTREAKEHVLTRYLGDDFRESRSIKLVQGVIDRDYNGNMSKKEADTFRVAFVVFVASNLLSPSAKYDYASIDYWNAIEDPDTIISFDWSEYVIDRLLAGVVKLRQDVSSNIKYPNITGCSLFLQVLYLDSLDLGIESLPHNSTPRISFFSYEKLCAMIAADSNYSRIKEDDSNLPEVKLRSVSGCIYSWASEQSSDTDEDSQDGCMLAIWECAVAMVHLLNIPMEAAGPIFVAAADFQDQVNAGLPITGIQALKFMSVIVSIMIPYRRGFRYQSSFSTGTDYRGYIVGDVINRGIRLISRSFRNNRKSMDKKAETQKQNSNHGYRFSRRLHRGNDWEASSSNNIRPFLDHGVIGDQVQRSLNSVISSLDSLPHNMNVSLRVATAMSHFYAMLRKLKSPRGFDLNEVAPDQFTSVHSAGSRSCLSPERLQTPWELGFVWAVDKNLKRLVLDYLSKIEDGESMAIIHTYPKHIQVSAVGLRDQFLGRFEMELDLFDSLIRLIRQQDDELYAPFGEHRWRIFFESHFMEVIVSGAYDLMNTDLCDQLFLYKKTFDISRCKLFNWLCYVWSIEENVIHVFDPCNSSPIPESRVEALERSCFLLKLALHTLCSSVFIGWTHNVSIADTRVLTLSDASVSRMNLSGVLCSLFCRCYDGLDMRSGLREIDTDGASALLCHQLVKLKDNVGILPVPLVDLEKLS